MFVKSFVALEIIPELDIDFGVVAVCCEISDKIDELTLFDYDYVDYFESGGLAFSYFTRKQFETGKDGRHKTNDGVCPAYHW